MVIILQSADKKDKCVTEFAFQTVNECEVLVFANMQLTGLILSGESFSNLLHLTINFNCLTSLKFLSSVKNLRHLNVQHNFLKSLEGAPTSLRVLKCSCNELASVDVLPNCCPGLQELWIAGNKFPHPSEFFDYSK